MRGLRLTPDNLTITERGAVVLRAQNETEDSPVGRLYWVAFAQPRLRSPSLQRPARSAGKKIWMPRASKTRWTSNERFYAPGRAVISLVAETFSVPGGAGAKSRRITERSRPNRSRNLRFLPSPFRTGMRRKVRTDEGRNGNPWPTPSSARPTEDASAPVGQA
jgi:hypothetical protein